MARNMKDTGIAWLGQIPEEWNIRPIKECFNERSEKVSDYEWEPLSVTKQGVVKQLENAAKSDAHDARKKVCKGDFVINSRSDRKQSCGLSDYDGSVSLINIVLRSENLYAGYVKYLLKNYGFAEEFYRWGTGIVDDLWSTNYQKMKRIMLPVPMYAEQEKIGKFLDEKILEIDDFLSKTRTSIEEYKKYKQAVITEVVTKGLDKDIETKNSGVEWIGKIPKHWTLRKVKSYTDMISKGTTPTDMSTVKTDEYKIRYLKSENIVENKLVLLPEFYITDEVNDLLERSKLSEKDIMFVIAGASIGKVAMMNKELLPANTNQAMAFLRIKDEYFNFARYIWYFLQSNIVSSVIALYSVQSAQPNLSMENLGNIRMPLSTNDKEIYKIVEHLDVKCGEIDALIAKKEAFVEEMEAYKKSLIYEYVTGKKEVL